MKRKLVKPTVVTPERAHAALKELGLRFAVTDEGDIMLPYPAHFVVMHSKIEEKSAVWSVVSHWPRKLDISYMSEAKNAIQRQAATEFAPKMTLTVADDGMIHFTVSWSFNWTPVATDDQIRKEIPYVLDGISRSFHRLNEIFKDPWQEEGQELQ